MEEELELLSTQLKSVFYRYTKLVEKTFNEKRHRALILRTYKPTYLTPIIIEPQIKMSLYHTIKTFKGDIIGEIKLTNQGLCYCIESEYQNLFEECL